MYWSRSRAFAGEEFAVFYQITPIKVAIKMRLDTSSS